MKRGHMIFIGVIAAVLLYIYIKGKRGVSNAVSSVVVGTVGGVVQGVGEVVGIPPTNASKCAVDMAAGDKTAASFDCDAVTFMDWLFKSTPKTVQAAAGTPSGSTGEASIAASYGSTP